MFRFPSNKIKSRGLGLSKAALWSACAFSMSLHAQPLLNFSDLTNGPDTGLGDGLGSGVIVTVWGQKLGSSQGDSKIEFCDSSAQCRTGHVYYWKNADGALPSGPADLFSSHQMQEIAFSIPDSAQGAGEIRVTTAEGSSSLPFTVRTGAIYHVHPGGNDSNDGSFSSPWATVQKSINKATAAGTTIYIHDVDTGKAVKGGGRQRGIYNNAADSTGTLDNQYAYVSYPGTRPTVTGTHGITAYNRDAFVYSKLEVFSSSHSSVNANGQESGQEWSTSWGIQTTADGRVVANKITDVPGWCASRTDGAIRGDAASHDKVSNAKIYGNEIYEYGCEGSYKLHHTTYLSIRSRPDDKQLKAWEFGWNYLHDNHAKNGIHQFDQDDDCGDLTTDLLIHNNVIVNQGGAGIAVGLSGCDAVWNTKIYNNVLIDVGRAAEWDGVDVSSSNAKATTGIHIRQSGHQGQIDIYNNTIYKWNDDDLNASTQGCLGFEGSRDTIKLSFSNNLCWTDKDKYFIGDQSTGDGLDDDVTGSSNVFFSSVSSPQKAEIPGFDANALTSNPMITRSGSLISVSESSPILQTASKMTTHDIYGNVRGALTSPGAVDLNTGAVLPSKPLPPTVLQLKVTTPGE